MSRGPRPIPFVEYHLRQLASPADVTIDVGCGPAAYRSVVPGHYLGIDFSRDDWAPGVRRTPDVVASAESLPLEAASVGLVFAVAALLDFPHPDVTLVEFRRVLRPGGRLVLFDYNRRTQRRLSRADHAVGRPCWTQWGLQRKVRRAGFHECRLLAPVERDVTPFEGWLRRIYQELIGQWVVVSAVRA